MNFQDLPINVDKLRKWIEKNLSKSEEQYDIQYIPPEPISSGDAEDNRAEYYQHAEPTTG